MLGFLRRRWRVVLRGSEISIPVEDDPRPIVGFIATRFVHAPTPEAAAARAISLVRSSWFNSPYSTVDRAGGPAFSVREVEQIRNPFRRSRPNKGYRFFQQDEDREGEVDGVPAAACPSPPD